MAEKCQQSPKCRVASETDKENRAHVQMSQLSKTIQRIHSDLACYSPLSPSLFLFHIDLNVFLWTIEIAGFFAQYLKTIAIDMCMTKGMQICIS